MRSLIPALFAALTALLSGPTSGQNVHTVHITGGPLVFTEQGVPTACGIRMVGGVNFPKPFSSSPFFAVLVRVYNGDESFVEFSSFIVTIGKTDAVYARKPVRVESAWVKALGAAPTLPTRQSFHGENKTTLLYTSSTESSHAVMLAALKGALVQIGMKRTGERDEMIFAGRVAINETDVEQLTACLKEIQR